MPKFPGFIGGSTQSQSTVANSSRTVNLYVEKGEVDALLPTPGQQQWSVVSNVGARALLSAAGSMFAIIGMGFYEFDSNCNATLRGTVAIDARPAQIVYNGVLGGQLGIGAGGNAYCYDLTSHVLTQVLSGECTMISYAAGRGFAFNINNGKTRLSNLNDLSTWDAGTFFQRGLFADPAQAVFADGNNLIWTIGTETFDVRYDSGTGTQPWVPLSGLVGAYGIVSPFAFGLSGLGNVWVAKTREGVGPVVVTRGSVPQAISDYTVNGAIARYLRTSTVEDAEVMLYQQEGHTFANVGFPTAGATWTADLEQPSWAERGKWNSVAGRYDVWTPRVHCFAYGKHLVGDRQTGIISWMDTSFVTEVDGTGIVRERTCSLPTSEHKRVPLDQLELLMDVGVAPATGAGVDPKAMLSVSQDGGQTFGNERQASYGRIGEYRKRVYWTRLGAPSHAVVRTRFSDPAPVRIVDAFLNNAEAA